MDTAQCIDYRIMTPSPFIFTKIKADWIQSNLYFHTIKHKTSRLVLILPIHFDHVTKHANVSGLVAFIRAFVCAVLLVVANLRKMELDPVVLTTAPTIIPTPREERCQFPLLTFISCFFVVFCFAAANESVTTLNTSLREIRFTVEPEAGWL